MTCLLVHIFVATNEMIYWNGTIVVQAAIFWIWKARKKWKDGTQRRNRPNVDATDRLNTVDQGKVVKGTRELEDGEELHRWGKVLLLVGNGKFIALLI